MSRGKRCLQVFHRRLDPVGDVERVGAGNLEHGDDGRRLAVVAADGVVEHRAQLEPRDVLEAHLGAVRVGAHDDVAELLLVEQAPLRADGVGVLGAGGGGRAADLAGRASAGSAGEMALAMSGIVMPSRPMTSGRSQTRIA